MSYRFTVTMWPHPFDQLGWRGGGKESQTQFLGHPGNGKVGSNWVWMAPGEPVLSSCFWNRALCSRAGLALARVSEAAVQPPTPVSILR